VLVTGASEGIGKALVCELVKANANVVFTSRNVQKLKIAHDELVTYKISSEQTLSYVAFDVTDALATRDALLKIVRDFGVPDLVINCAGYAKPGYIENLQIEDFTGMVNLNLMGIVNVCHVLAPIFAQHKKGHIVNTSSIAGFVAMFGYTAYCASKYAVIGFSEALRREMKPFGVTVSVLCPPNTQTPGFDRENLTKPPEVLKTEEKLVPVSAEFVAKKLLQAIPKKRFYIIPTFDGKISHFVSRHFPFVVDWIVKRPNPSSL